ncbi:peptidyl-prolyl cis-trans isomerase PASTICCINO1 [Selaginella moellendorffii]|nr:peptidyl-prolyl cis-trans isomerase PASTICCINO1 [Selaginella moellendorffii]|eukprot:XP_024532699.1 peptidyl-prolyl cis-trans isomerase PASTICCINO1 [Selaginella moellendorffii]
MEDDAVPGPAKHAPVDRDSKDSKKSIPIPPGGLMKAVVRPGAGDNPQSGNQVIFHCTTRTSEGVIVESTRPELGGSGEPIKLVLGKSKMIRGWEEGLLTVPKGEIAMLKILPEFHYGDPDCPVSAREDFPKHEILIFEIEMLEIRPVKVITDDFGVLKQVLREGEGFETAREPYEIKVWITGSVNGEVFFSHTKGNPFEFCFGKKEVPVGLEKGIGTMTKGEKAIVYVTTQYLTPSSAIPDLPVTSGEVAFEVEVVQIIQVRDMFGDGRVVKRRIRDGVGEFPMDCPLQDSTLRIHYKGMLPNEGGKVFVDTRNDNEGGEPLVFATGEGLVPEGLEICIKLMLPGELALITCSPEYAYDKFPRPKLVPENAQVQWEVELLSFDAVKDWTGYNFKEIMDDATKMRTTGNRLFKEGKFELAKAKYEKILREFKHVNPQDDNEGVEFAQARTLIQLNVAACEQKQGNFRKCIELCNQVLEVNPCHSKALYRRGNAFMGMGDFDDARKDFEKMASTDKSSEADAKAALSTLKRKEQEANARVRKQFQGLFDKKPGELSKETLEPREVAENSARSEEQQPEEIVNPPSSLRQRMKTIWNAGRSLWRGQKCVIL